MVRSTKWGERGGEYFNVFVKPGAGSTGANATVRIPTNYPPMGRLQVLQVRVFVGTAGSFNLTNYTIVKKSASPGAAKACLVDFRTVRLGTAHTGANKNEILILAAAAAEGYSGAQDDRA